MTPSQLHPGSKPVILIIDDEEFYRATLSDAFREQGYRTFAAPDGNEGFVMYRKILPDVVILDRIMSQSGGTRFLMSVKGLPNRKEGLLVVYSSTVKESGGTVRESGAQQGFSKVVHISKSTPPDELPGLVQRIATSS